MMMTCLDGPLFAGTAQQQHSLQSEENWQRPTGDADRRPPSQVHRGVRRRGCRLETSRLRGSRLPYPHTKALAILPPVAILPPDEGRSKSEAAQQEICSVWRPLGKDRPHLQVRNPKIALSVFVFYSSLFSRQNFSPVFNRS